MVIVKKRAIRKVEKGESLQENWNKTVTHPVQSWEWGKFREKTGLTVVRFSTGKGKSPSGFQLTIHKIPHTPWAIGYLPKCNMPDKEAIPALKRRGKAHNCIYVQIEPDIEKTQNSDLKLKTLGLRESLRPLFFKYTFLIDLTKSEEELTRDMHPKTRYNIKIAMRNNIRTEERADEEAFKTFLKLYFETTKRQKYFGHTERYHQLLWDTLRPAGIARLLIAYYAPPGDGQSIPLTAWMIFKFGDRIYYPYGGSADIYKNFMANNLVAWEAILLGKKLGAKEFDLWGCLGLDSNTRDPWYGFHRFKAGYGGRLVEYVGSHDLILISPLYFAFHLIERIRWLILRIRSIV